MWGNQFVELPLDVPPCAFEVRLSCVLGAFEVSLSSPEDAENAERRYVLLGVSSCPPRDKLMFPYDDANMR